MSDLRAEFNALVSRLQAWLDMDHKDSITLSRHAIIVLIEGIRSQWCEICGRDLNRLDGDCAEDSCPQAVGGETAAAKTNGETEYLERHYKSAVAAIRPWEVKP